MSLLQDAVILVNVIRSSLPLVNEFLKRSFLYEGSRTFVIDYLNDIHDASEKLQR